ncbi:hypothetical protein K8I85_17720, partial [bacterium]|nr:hypothetical protein [bacterium]
MAEPKRRVKTPAQLREYRRKRDFAKTTEPSGGDARGRRARASKGNAFVIHRHEARNLHYDLRLELDGVLVSWAVPRGFSWVPSDKHLAVRTEDHPLEYLDFDGVIPKGEYGAGTMMIWDHGTYETRYMGLGEALEAGEVKVVLDGGKLRGEWHLVRTRGEKDWLLFKTRDRYAREEGDALFPLAFDPETRAPSAGRVRAMRAKENVAPFADAEWLYELDFAGRRALAIVRDGDVRFRGADGKRLPAALPELAGELAGIRCRDAILDGVLVAADDTGRPDGKLLAKRLKSGDTAEVAYYA